MGKNKNRNSLLEKTIDASFSLPQFPHADHDQFLFASRLPNGIGLQEVPAERRLPLRLNFVRFAPHTIQVRINDRFPLIQDSLREICIVQEMVDPL